jgi:hypothetical protein
MVPQALAMSSLRHPSAFILTPHARPIHQQQQHSQVFEAMEVGHARLSAWNMAQKRAVYLSLRVCQALASRPRIVLHSQGVYQIVVFDYRSKP